MPRLAASLAIAAALGGALLVGGCSYRPLYGSSGETEGVAVTLSSITIPEADTRVAQIIRNDLISGMRPSGEERYTLIMKTEYKTSRVIGKVQPAVTREQVHVSVAYELIERQSGAAVTSGKTFAQASFDVVRQPVADTQAETDATERAAHEVSADIRTRLAAFFATRT